MNTQKELDYIAEIANLKIENERLRKSIRPQETPWQERLAYYLLNRDDISAVWYSSPHDMFSLEVKGIKSSGLVEIAKRIVELSE